MTIKIESTQIILDEQNPAPGTPASGKVALYAKSTGGLFSKDDTGAETALGGGGGGMTSFTVAGDSGTPQTITDGNTLTIAGGTGLSSVASATDTVTINLDAPVTVTLGGTGADLSATGGTGQVVKQATLGGAFTVGTLAASEIPNLDASKITSGTFAEARGGTNQSTYTTGDILYASGTNTLAKRAIGTSGQVLTVTGGVPVWATPAGSLPSRAELRWQTAQGGGGLSITGNTWTTVTLNTETSDPDSIVGAPSSNLFIPVSGTFEIFVQLNRMEQNYRLRLFNSTAAAAVTTVVSTNGRQETDGYLIGRFTANGTDAYAIQVWMVATAQIANMSLNNATIGDEIKMRILLDKVG